MKNFIFKSTDADLQKMFSILENLQKNLVYVTYRCDSILKILRSNETDKGLQKQVDAYFGRDSDNTTDTKDSEFGEEI